MSDNTQIERIIVGYDGSEDSDTGLDWAMATATRTGRALRVVVVADTTDTFVPEAWPVIKQHARETLDRAEKKLAEVGVADATVEVVEGPASHRLCALPGPDDLLVVGSLGHGRLGGTLVGSVSAYLIRHAACPVVVARPVASQEAGQIAVGLDGSDASLLALGWATHFARATGSGDVVALHGFRGTPEGGLGADTGDALSRRVDRAQRDLRAWVAHAPLLPTPEIRTEAVAVPAGKLLVDVSKDSALVVVGARGHGGVAGVLVGSVVDQVVAHAHCPVVVVR